MKLTVVIDKDREEEIVLYLHEHTELENRISHIVKSERFELVGYLDREIVKLSASEVSRFFTESGRTLASVAGKLYRVDHRIYELEDALGDGFVKINQSCIANISKIERFDASLAGSLLVVFKDGGRDYVSRRQLKVVKERIGFKL